MFSSFRAGHSWLPAPVFALPAGAPPGLGLTDLWSFSGRKVLACRGWCRAKSGSRVQRTRDSLGDGGKSSCQLHPSHWLLFTPSWKLRLHSAGELGDAMAVFPRVFVQ